jgi:hypothetical protein
MTLHWRPASLVRVLAKPLATFNAILIDHPQAAVAHVRRVVIVRERESVVAVQPAMIGMTAFFGSS